jgi:hypothetical protein
MRPRPSLSLARTSDRPSSCSAQARRRPAPAVNRTRGRLPAASGRPHDGTTLKRTDVSDEQKQMTHTLTRPFRDRQTYRNLLYLALALPLGLVEFLFLVAGLALTLVLLVTLLGVVVLERTVNGAFALARLEQRITAGLLRTDVPVVTPHSAPAGASIARRLGVCLRCGTTWRRLGYLAAKLPLATITFALAGAALALSATLLAAPFYAHGLAAFAFAIAGAAALPAALHVINALAGLWARLGRALLPAAA